VFAAAGPDRQETLGRVQAMMPELRLYGVEVGWECRFVHQNQAAASAGAVKGREHQVQVDSQAVHEHDFVAESAGEFRTGFA